MYVTQPELMQSWHARKNQLASQCRCVRQLQLAIECRQANKGQVRSCTEVMCETDPTTYVRLAC